MSGAYTFTQTTPALTWVIAHNFDELPVCDVMSMVDGSLQKIMPASMVHTDSNTLTLTFSIATSGSARVVGTRTTNAAFARDPWIPSDGSPNSSAVPVQNVDYEYYNFVQLANSSGFLTVAYEDGSTVPFYIGQNYNDAIISQSSIDDSLLRTSGFDGNTGSESIAVGHPTIGVTDNVPPVLVGTTVSHSGEDGGAGPIYWRTYFMMRLGDSIWVTARTPSGEDAGYLTLVVGPSATEGDRYTLNYSGVTNTFPHTGTISVTRLTDIGARTPAFV